MRRLATFANPGEAGFFQSLLEEAGIDSDLQDGILDLGGVRESRIFVVEDDYERAVDILKHHRQPSAPAQAASSHKHPAAGFPFLGITGLVALLWSLGNATLALVRVPSGELWVAGWISGGLQVLGIFAFSLVSGLLWGAMIAAGCLAGTITWRKLTQT